MKKRTKGRSAPSRQSKTSRTKKRGADAPPSAPPTTSGASTGGGRTGREATKPAPESAEPSGAERIYAFADQLNEESRRRKGQETVEERSESWVSFTLGEETYALPVGAVHEILRVAQITRVPHAPPSVLGVCNRRGRVLPVVDLRIRLGLVESPTTPASRIMVAASDGRLLGLLVDSVRQVETVLRSRVQSPPESVAAVAAGAVQGVVDQEGRMVVLLELASLLHLGQAGGEKIA